MPSVIIVGAGLAGLAAAHRLNRHGVATTVVEARERVGGRVLSVRLGNGAIAELGGEWIHSGQRAVLRLAANLRIEVVDVGLDFTVREPIGRRPVPIAAQQRVAAAVADRLSQLGPGRRQRSSAAAVLDSITIEPEAMALLRSRLAGSAAQPLDRVAASEIDGGFGLAGGRYLRCRGGNQQLAEALAATLPDVRLDTPAVAVHDAAVTIAGGETLQAGAVVLSVPLPLLQVIDIRPSVPAAAARLTMGAGAKLAMSTTTAPPLLARQLLDPPIWYWTGLGEDGDTRRVVTAFAGTRRSVAAALAGWPEALGAAMPEVEPLGEAHIVDWSADPWARGCYSSLGPGDAPLLDAFSRPHGRIVYAGEHTNGSGTIDGAIRSGERAADLVIDLLR